MERLKIKLEKKPKSRRMKNGGLRKTSNADVDEVPKTLA